MPLSPPPPAQESQLSLNICLSLLLELLGNSKFGGREYTPYKIYMKTLVICPASLRSMWENELRSSAIVNKPVAEEQALVAQVLQSHLNHPEMDRQELRELRKFLRQPLVGASVQQLRNAIQGYSRTNDVQMLIETVRSLYHHQGTGSSHDFYEEKSVSKIRREDLRLICYEYISA